jgi:hypothetical protein
MGWINYLLIPDLKLGFEISRYVNQDTFNYVSENVDGLVKEVEEFDPDILAKKCNGMNLSDLASLVKISDKAIVFNELDYAYLFMSFLVSRGIGFSIISEFEYENRKDEFKDCRIIKR